MTDPDYLAAIADLGVAGDRSATADADAMTISKEVLTVGTEWAEAGRIRLRRRLITETRTVQVTLRREELQIQIRDIDQRGNVLTGSDAHGAVTDPPQPRQPLVFLLQEEVPVVSVHRQPYERVVVEVGVVERTGRVRADLRHEELTLETAATPLPRDTE